MSFSFGNTQQTGFGSAQNKPTAFGAPFGSAPTSTSSTFGFGSTFGAAAPAQPPAFGAQTSQTPAFGATAFGQPNVGAAAPTFGAVPSAAPAFGSAFGQTTSAPAFGTAFGATAPSGGLFSSASKPNLFGTATTQSTGLFSAPAAGTTGLFGSSTPGGGLFGSTPSTQTGAFGAPIASTSTTPSLFGSFGTTTSTPGLFGTTTTGSGFGLFGGGTTTSTTTAPSLFSGFGTTTGAGSGFGGFGSTTGTGFGAPSGGSNFGTTALTGFGGGTNKFGGFGANPGVLPTFGNTPAPTVTTNAPPPGPVPDLVLQQTLASFYAVNIFGDERDEVLKKWNMLQASWGTGKGYYASPNLHVVYTPSNPLFRFKSIGYNMVIDSDNSEGVVRLIFNRKEAEIRSSKQTIITGLVGILGNKPNLSVEVNQIKALNDNQTEVKIVVLEKGVTGTTRKIPAHELANFLNALPQKQQLAKADVFSITPYVSPTKAELDEYLSKPPIGVTDQMWMAAKSDNPNSSKYIPVPINGFSELKNRMLMQVYETDLHASFLQNVNEQLTELRNKHASSLAQINTMKQTFLQIQHKILHILVKQECLRKVGMTLLPEEEILKGRLETINNQLNVSTQFKGQLDELCSCVKTHGKVNFSPPEQYKIEGQMVEEIKQFLTMQQLGITQLKNIINEDMRAVNIISDGLNRLVLQNNALLSLKRS